MASMGTYLSLPNILILPVALLLLSGLFIRSFLNILLTIKLYAGAYSSNNMVESIRPLLKRLSAVLDLMLGTKVSKEKITLTHLLLGALMIVLIGIFSALIDSNKRAQRKQKSE